ncbi:endonuclease V [Blastocladiella britannica]|nr:endonuclease V [Blastocladiella britannica]
MREDDSTLDFDPEDQQLRGLERIAGVDISFFSTDDHLSAAPNAAGDDAVQHAIAYVTVLEWPSLEPVYSAHARVHLMQPYIPGFLAFREVDPLLALLRAIPDHLAPQVLLVDGNGKLHPRRFGLASHLGVLLGNVPTIGVAKNYLHIPDAANDALGMATIRARARSELTHGGAWFPLVARETVVFGAALRPLESTTNAIYVSVGHSISLESAVKVVTRCCKYRIPEPIRVADLRSRELVRAALGRGDMGQGAGTSTNP